MRLDESETQVVDPVSLDYNIIAAHDTFKNLEIRIYAYITQQIDRNFQEVYHTYILPTIQTRL